MRNHDIQRFGGDVAHNPVERIAFGACVDEQGAFRAFHDVHGGHVGGFNYPPALLQWRDG